ncbi:MAG: hypothetical protein C4329_00190 [Chitinophagaceae bacterium]
MRWERDKWKHFYVGIAMGAFLQAAGWRLLPMHHALATGAAFITVLAISYGFELFSLITGRGHYEVMDAIAAIIGGVAGMVAVLLVQLF